MDLSLKKYLLESCTTRSSNPTNGRTSNAHIGEGGLWDRKRSKWRKGTRENTPCCQTFAKFTCKGVVCSLARSSDFPVSFAVCRERKIIAERVSSAGRTRRDNFHLSTLVIGSFSGYLVYFSSLPTVHVYVSLYLAQSSQKSSHLSGFLLAFSAFRNVVNENICQGLGCLLCFKV